MLPVACCRNSFSLWRTSSLTPSLARTFFNHAAQRPIPPPTGSISTPQDFLKAIGRSMDTKINVETWEELWKLHGPVLKKQGVAVKDRRYTLWCISKYRAGIPLHSFTHEPRPKLAMRGWGPKIVNGKINRSKRDKRK
ncbi:hypothetical protein C8J56DRAFT_1038461 [Mycena floridula]|nr:hypothetical protein C8J56DRAFT_1038461 [Mycena floridula]